MAETHKNIRMSCLKTSLKFSLTVLYLMILGLSTAAFAQSCPNTVPGDPDACEFVDPADDLGCCNSNTDSVEWTSGKYYRQCVSMGGDLGDRWVSLDGSEILGSCFGTSVTNTGDPPWEVCYGGARHEYHALCVEGSCRSEGDVDGSNYCELGQGMCPILSVSSQVLDTANWLGKVFGGLTCQSLIIGANIYSGGTLGECWGYDFDPLNPGLEYEWVDVTPDCSTGTSCPASDAGEWTWNGSVWEYCAPGTTTFTTSPCDLDGDGVNESTCKSSSTSPGTIYQYVESCCTSGCHDPTWVYYNACEPGMGTPMYGEEAVTTIGGESYYCDGVGWEKFPDVDDLVDCPLPSLTDGGTTCSGGTGTGHPFADREHVRCLEREFYGIDDTGTHQEDEGWLAPFWEFGEEMSETMMWQAFTIGTFFDAAIQLETQRTMQVLKAESHKRYKPDEQICRFGTNVRSLAPSEAVSTMNTHALSQAMARREYRVEDSAGARGIIEDIPHRLYQFKTTYCDPNEANISLGKLCAGTSPPDRINKDIDYTRTIDAPYTLDIDFTDTNLSGEEEDVLALGSYLFSHKIFPELAKEFLKEDYVHDEILDMRSVHALRSVARNSFSHIVGMKAAGTGEVDQFMYRLVREVGVPQAEIDEFLGANPSYFAQMEVLTKFLFQSPEFYTNLHVSPENVSRIGVALQAVDLMQDRDRFEAALRREILVSLILESKLREMQDTMTTDILQDLSPLLPIFSP